MALDWPSLHLSEQLLSTFKFPQPTPVQAATIPLLLNHRDVAVEACTGSGKTLAYLLPTIQLLLQAGAKKSHQWGGLILVPTRELARQVEGVARPLCIATNLTPTLVIGGGDSSSAQLVIPKRFDLIIGTPGRVEELLNSRNCGDVKTLEVLILDEADVLLQAGFSIQIGSILSRLPKQRRTGLFSATQTNELKSLIRAGLRNPATISVKVNSLVPNSVVPTTQRTPLQLENKFLVCESDEKLQFLVNFCSQNPTFKLIVFLATCASVDFFGDCILKPLLLRKSIQVWTLHGKMTPKRRTLSFEAFSKAECGVLVCTDVAARGIDLPDVDWIIQIDCPKEPDFFVHRVGRTARAGRRGGALLLVQPNEEAFVEYLKSQRVPIEKLIEHKENEPFDVLEEARRLVFSDRDILEKGTKAFVAFIAHYTEHQLSYLFRVEELNWAKLAKAFVLLRLPRLKELRGDKSAKIREEFVEESDQVISAIEFKDKVREEKRQKLLREGKEFNAKKKKPESKQAKQERLVVENKNLVTKKRKRKGQNQKIIEEWDELQREERLHRKLKRGKISKQEYEQLVRGEEEDEF